MNPVVKKKIRVLQYHCIFVKKKKGGGERIDKKERGFHDNPFSVISPDSSTPYSICYNLGEKSD